MTFLSRPHSTARRGKEKPQKAGMSTFVSIVISVVFIAFSALLIVNSVKSVNVAYQRNQLLDQAEDEVEALRLRNLQLIQELDDVSGDTYVEEQARDRLLYTKDGEILLIVPEDVSEAKDEEVDTEEENQAIPVTESGWERWWDLLIQGV